MGANFDRLILVLAGGAALVALNFGVHDPIGFVVWIGLGLALVLPATFPWFLLHALVLRSTASLESAQVRRLLSIAGGGACVIAIPVPIFLLGDVAPVRTSFDRGGLFVLALGLVYGAVTKLPETEGAAVASFTDVGTPCPGNSADA